MVCPTTLSSAQDYRDWWTMNWKGCGRKRLWYNFRYYLRMCQNGLRDITKNMSHDCTTAYLKAKIWSQSIPRNDTGVLASRRLSATKTVLPCVFSQLHFDNGFPFHNDVILFCSLRSTAASLNTTLIALNVALTWSVDPRFKSGSKTSTPLTKISAG